MEANGCEVGELESVRSESWGVRRRRTGGCEVGELESEGRRAGGCEVGDQESEGAENWRMRRA